jgi:hypothetical protein
MILSLDVPPFFWKFRYKLYFIQVQPSSLPLIWYLQLFLLKSRYADPIAKTAADHPGINPMHSSEANTSSLISYDHNFIRKQKMGICVHSTTPASTLKFA